MVDGRYSKECNFVGGNLLATTQRALSEVLPLAQWALSDSPIFDLRDLTVEEGEEALVLRGRVASYYHKQMAQEVVRAVAGREIDVINSIAVREAGLRGPTQIPAGYSDSCQICGKLVVSGQGGPQEHGRYTRRHWPVIRQRGAFCRRFVAIAP